MSAIAVVLVLIVGGGVGYLYYVDHQIKRIAVGHLSSASIDGTENILMVGSTSRCALKVQHAAYGLCDEGVNGVNSDVVMLLHLDPSTGAASILSIPRDLFVPNARTTGPDKIDAALAQGPTQLVATIEDDFGIPIQHYVELNFESFSGVVNALGGVKMYFPMPLFDAQSGLNIQTAGCHELNGVQALALVRARHLQYRPPGVAPWDEFSWPHDPESDLSRIQRDHEFLTVLASAVAKQGLGDLVTDEHLLASVAPQLKVDRGLSLSAMVHLVFTFHDLNPAKTPQLTLPVIVDTASSYVYDGYDQGSVEFPDEPLDQQVIDEFLHPSATPPAAPSPGTVTVGVLNETGAQSNAAATAAQLQGLGYDVVATTSAAPPATIVETVVDYASPAAEPAAAALAASMSGPVVLGLGPTLPGSDVTVVTGGASTVIAGAPGPSTTVTTAPTSTSAPLASSSTTTTTPSASAVSDLDAPTSATSPLAPFDPRPCTADGREGS